jgi:hypothetical protein
MINFLPKTVLGKWSVGLIVTFFLLLAVLKVFLISGQWASDAVKLLAGSITAVAAVGAFFTGIIGVVKSKEGAFLVLLSIVTGFIVLMFLLPGIVGWVVGFFGGPAPIPQENQAFVGVWRSESGFQLEIKAEGTADIRQIANRKEPDCKTLNIGVAPQGVEGMRVKFTGKDNLEVVTPGLYGKVYHIDRTPFVEKGLTEMVLNGVTFVKD